MKTENQPGQENENNSKKKKVLNTIVNVILVVVIVFGIFVAFTAFVTKKGSGVPNFLGVEFFSIQSDSMKPTFEKGDMIIDIKVKDASKLKEGDVITFWTVINGETALNSHRITKKEKITAEDGSYSYYMFRTKGDNTETNKNEDDLSVRDKDVVGKYTGIKLPWLGSLIDYLQTGTGFLIVIVIPVALFTIWQLIQFFRTLFAYQAEKTKMKYEAQMKMMEQQMQQKMMAESQNYLQEKETGQSSADSEQKQQ